MIKMATHSMVTRSKTKISTRSPVKLNNDLMIIIAGKLRSITEKQQAAKTDGDVTVAFYPNRLTATDCVLLHSPLLWSVVDMGITSMLDFIQVYYGGGRMRWPDFNGVKCVRVPDECLDIDFNDALPVDSQTTSMWYRLDDKIYVMARHIEKVALSWCAMNIRRRNEQYADILASLSSPDSSVESEVSLI